LVLFGGQVEREKFKTLTCEELRAFILKKCPKLTRAVEVTAQRSTAQLGTA
jgi:hypothetical protein